MLTCTKCKQEKTYTEFSPDKKGKSGYKSWCKQCAREYQALRLRENPESVRAAGRKWYGENREQKLAANRQWCLDNVDRRRESKREPNRRYAEAHREELNQKAREQRAADPAREREKTRRWAQANPDKANARWHRRRALLKGAFVENVTLSFLKERDGGICGICQEPVTDDQRASIDHIIPLARGGEHSRQNTQYAHLSCNSRKGARVDEAA